jgi:hypothetical protein
MTDTITDTGAAPAPNEFAALDAIALEASGDERAREQAQEEAAHPEGMPDQAELWGLIPMQLGALLSMALPELRGVYTEQACREWGVGMAAVSQKYGWDAADTLAKYAPELALVTATIPLAVPTYFAIRKRLDAAAEKREREQPRAEPMKDLNPEPVPAGRQEPGGFSEPH